jgi:hypothetical protein
MLDTPDEFEFEFEKVDLILGDHKNSLTVLLLHELVLLSVF